MMPPSTRGIHDGHYTSPRRAGPLFGFLRVGAARRAGAALQSGKQSHLRGGPAVRAFFEVVDADPGCLDPALADRAANFRAMLAERFGWLLDGAEDDAEDMPVVVEL